MGWSPRYHSASAADPRVTTPNSIWFWSGHTRVNPPLPAMGDWLSSWSWVHARSCCSRQGPWDVSISQRRWWASNGDKWSSGDGILAMTFSLGMFPLFCHSLWILDFIFALDAIFLVRKYLPQAYLKLWGPHFSTRLLEMLEILLFLNILSIW